MRSAYLLTGSRSASVDLVSGAMTSLLTGMHGKKDIQDLQQALMLEVARQWLSFLTGDSRGTVRRATDAASVYSEDVPLAQFWTTLARLDNHQRGLLVLHDFSGLPVDELAGVFDLAPEIVYLQLLQTRGLVRIGTGLKDADDLAGKLRAASFDAPSQAIWPLIRDDVEVVLARRARRQRLLTAAVAVVVIALVTASVFFVLDQEPASVALPGTPTNEPDRAFAQTTPFSVLPTSTPTPAANVDDTILVQISEAGALRTTRFGESPGAALLGETAVEADVPIVSPDGEQVFMLWYDYRSGRATGYLAAFDNALNDERWRTTIAVDDEVEPGERADIQMAAAVDHERVYVARHSWKSGDNIEIDVFDRESGERLETIGTNLTGFAAADVRLHAPPGLNRVHLFAITNDAPPETGALTITFLGYQVPGGEKVHGRILFDQPDSRTFFLYESQLVAGGTTLFGVEHTSYYQHIAVHFFDLESGRVLPRLVLPFDQVADPMPYQQSVSNDGHWLYVLSPSSLEVAVVNLFDRSLAGMVPLDPGVVAGEPVGVGYLPGKAMQLSPDGRRLYALGTADGRSSGVWVIDVESWTVIDHWLPDVEVAKILLSGDGRILYLRRMQMVNQTSPAGALIAVDVDNGNASEIDVPESGRFSLASIVTLYQRTYAVSPSVNGVVPSGVFSTAPLAAAQVEVNPGMTPATETVSIDVQFIHPLTREPVSEDGQVARYEEPGGVRVAWLPESGEAPVILELGRVGYGHYQGFVRLPQAGIWSARVDVDWPDGGIQDRSVTVADAVKILPMANATDAPTIVIPLG